MRTLVCVVLVGGGFECGRHPIPQHTGLIAVYGAGGGLSPEQGFSGSLRKALVRNVCLAYVTFT